MRISKYFALAAAVAILALAKQLDGQLHDGSLSPGGRSIFNIISDWHPEGSNGEWSSKSKQQPPTTDAVNQAEGAIQSGVGISDVVANHSIGGASASQVVDATQSGVDFVANHAVRVAADNQVLGSAQSGVDASNAVENHAIGTATNAANQVKDAVQPGVDAVNVGGNQVVQWAHPGVNAVNVVKNHGTVTGASAANQAEDAAQSGVDAENAVENHAIGTADNVAGETSNHNSGHKLSGHLSDGLRNHLLGGVGEGVSINLGLLPGVGWNSQHQARGSHGHDHINGDSTASHSIGVATDAVNQAEGATQSGVGISDVVANHSKGGASASQDVGATQSGVDSVPNHAVTVAADNQVLGSAQSGVDASNAVENHAIGTASNAANQVKDAAQHGVDAVNFGGNQNVQWAQPGVNAGNAVNVVKNHGTGTGTSAANQAEDAAQSGVDAENAVENHAMGTADNVAGETSNHNSGHKLSGHLSDGLRNHLLGGVGEGVSINLGLLPGVGWNSQHQASGSHGHDRINGDSTASHAIGVATDAVNQAEGATQSGVGISDVVANHSIGGASANQDVGATQSGVDSVPNHAVKVAADNQVLGSAQSGVDASNAVENHAIGTASNAANQVKDAAQHRVDAVNVGGNQNVQWAQPGVNPGNAVNVVKNHGTGTGTSAANQAEDAAQSGVDAENAVENHAMGTADNVAGETSNHNSGHKLSGHLNDGLRNHLLGAVGEGVSINLGLLPGVGWNSQHQASGSHGHDHINGDSTASHAIGVATDAVNQAEGATQSGVGISDVVANHSIGGASANQDVGATQSGVDSVPNHAVTVAADNQVLGSAQSGVDASNAVENHAIGTASNAANQVKDAAQHGVDGVNVGGNQVVQWAQPGVNAGNAVNVVKNHGTGTGTSAANQAEDAAQSGVDAENAVENHAMGTADNVAGETSNHNSGHKLSGHLSDGLRNHLLGGVGEGVSINLGLLPGVGWNSQHQASGSHGHDHINGDSTASHAIGVATDAVNQAEGATQSGVGISDVVANHSIGGASANQDVGATQSGVDSVPNHAVTVAADNQVLGSAQSGVDASNAVENHAIGTASNAANQVKDAAQHGVDAVNVGGKQVVQWAQPGVNAGNAVNVVKNHGTGTGTSAANQAEDAAQSGVDAENAVENHAMGTADNVAGETSNHNSGHKLSGHLNDGLRNHLLGGVGEGVSINLGLLPGVGWNSQHQASGSHGHDRINGDSTASHAIGVATDAVNQAEGATQSGVGISDVVANHSIGGASANQDVGATQSGVNSVPNHAVTVAADNQVLGSAQSGVDASNAVENHAIGTASNAANQVKDAAQHRVDAVNVGGNQNVQWAQPGVNAGNAVNVVKNHATGTVTSAANQAEDAAQSGVDAENAVENHAIGTADNVAGETSNHNSVHKLSGHLSDGLRNHLLGAVGEGVSINLGLLPGVGWNSQHQASGSHGHDHINGDSTASHAIGVATDAVNQAEGATQSGVGISDVVANHSIGGASANQDVGATQSGVDSVPNHAVTVAADNQVLGSEQSGVDASYAVENHAIGTASNAANQVKDAAQHGVDAVNVGGNQVVQWAQPGVNAGNAVNVVKNQTTATGTSAVNQAEDAAQSGVDAENAVENHAMGTADNVAGETSNHNSGHKLSGHLSDGLRNHLLGGVGEGVSINLGLLPGVGWNSQHQASGSHGHDHINGDSTPSHAIGVATDAVNQAEGATQSGVGISDVVANHSIGGASANQDVGATQSGVDSVPNHAVTVAADNQVLGSAQSGVDASNAVENHAIGTASNAANQVKDAAQPGVDAVNVGGNQVVQWAQPGVNAGNAVNVVKNHGTGTGTSAANQAEDAAQSGVDAENAVENHAMGTADNVAGETANHNSGHKLSGHLSDGLRNHLLGGVGEGVSINLGLLPGVGWNSQHQASGSHGHDHINGDSTASHAIGVATDAVNQAEGATQSGAGISDVVANHSIGGASVNQDVGATQSGVDSVPNHAVTVAADNQVLGSAQSGVDASNAVENHAIGTASNAANQVKDAAQHGVDAVNVGGNQVVQWAQPGVNAGNAVNVVKNHGTGTGTSAANQAEDAAQSGVDAENAVENHAMGTADNVAGETSNHNSGHKLSGHLSDGLRNHLLGGVGEGVSINLGLLPGVGWNSQHQASGSHGHDHINGDSTASHAIGVATDAVNQAEEATQSGVGISDVVANHSIGGASANQDVGATQSGVDSVPNHAVTVAADNQVLGSAQSGVDASNAVENHAIGTASNAANQVKDAAQHGVDAVNVGGNQNVQWAQPGVNAGNAVNVFKNHETGTGTSAANQAEDVAQSGVDAENAVENHAMGTADNVAGETSNHNSGHKLSVHLSDGLRNHLLGGVGEGVSINLGLLPGVGWNSQHQASGSHGHDHINGDSTASHAIGVATDAVNQAEGATQSGVGISDVVANHSIGGASANQDVGATQSGVDSVPNHAVTVAADNQVLGSAQSGVDASNAVENHAIGTATNAANQVKDAVQHGVDAVNVGGNQVVQWAQPGVNAGNAVNVVKNHATGTGTSAANQAEDAAQSGIDAENAVENHAIGTADNVAGETSNHNSGHKLSGHLSDGLRNHFLGGVGEGVSINLGLLPGGGWNSQHQASASHGRDHINGDWTINQAKGVATDAVNQAEGATESGVGVGDDVANHLKGGASANQFVDATQSGVDSVPNHAVTVAAYGFSSVVGTVGVSASGSSVSTQESHSNGHGYGNIVSFFSGLGHLLG